MSLLQWDGSLVTGIPGADHEHEKLVELINSVHAGWQAERNPDPSRLFDDLFNILQSHFASEDRIMSECRYAERRAHALDHDQIVGELRAMLAHAADAGCDVSAALAGRLQPWLVNHIRVHDVPLYKAVDLERAVAASDSRH